MAEVEIGALVDVGLPVALGIMMFGMGMGLSIEDFRRVAARPRAIAAGMLAQVVLLPLFAVAVALAFRETVGLAPALVAGLLLLASCPGGVTSNLVAHLSRADVALSVSLTSVSSLAAALLTPLTFLAATSILGGEAALLRVSFVSMAGLVLAIVAIPIALGILARRRRPDLAARADRPFRVASIALFALIVAGVIAENRANFWTLAAAAVPASLALNLLALGGGYAVARSAGLAIAERRAVAIETAFQSGTLGMTLAVTQLGSPEAAIIPGFYGLVMFATGGAAAWTWSRSSGGAAESAPRAAEPPLQR